MHITHGSTVTYKVVFESRWVPAACAAARRARTSACAVGSRSATLALPACASACSPSTTTAAIGVEERVRRGLVQERRGGDQASDRPPNVDRATWASPWRAPRQRASPRPSRHLLHPPSQPPPDTSSRRPRRSPSSERRPTPSVRSPGTCSPACSSPSRRTRNPPSPATALHRSPSCRASCVSLLALARTPWIQIAPPLEYPAAL